MRDLMWRRGQYHTACSCALHHMNSSQYSLVSKLTKKKRKKLYTSVCTCGRSRFSTQGRSHGGSSEHFLSSPLQHTCRDESHHTNSITPVNVRGNDSLSVSLDVSCLLTIYVHQEQLPPKSVASAVLRGYFNASWLALLATLSPK